jgi:predicted AAA+ superfamily ATPase
MFYQRKLYQTLKKYYDDPQAIVITGMRRVGKTTLLKKVYEEIPSENKKYLDLENPANWLYFRNLNFDKIILSLFDGHIPKGKIYLFLDEMQNIKNLPSIVKYLLDTYQVKFFLTGSVSFYLKNFFSESLSGRKFLFELSPLDFQEFLEFKGISYKPPMSLSDRASSKLPALIEKYRPLYEEFLRFGGFPSVVLQAEEKKKREELKDILFSYLELDVRKITHIRKIRQAEDLIKLLATRCGNKLDIQKLASEIGISRQTIYEYLYFFEKTYLLSLLSPYSKSPDREISGAKKVYFIDNGLINILTQASVGQLLENSVFNALKKYGSLNYYQRRSGVEIDFIQEKQIAFEVKQKGSNYDLLKLKKYARKLKIDEFYLITQEFLGGENIIWAGDL